MRQAQSLSTLFTDHDYRKVRESFFTWLSEKSAYAFCVGFPDGRMVIFNQALLDLTGYTREELLNASWSKTLTPPEWREHEAAVLKELHRTGKPQIFEKEYIRKDGSRVPVELTIQLERLQSTGAEIYYAFIKDISERRNIQIEQQKLSEQRQLALDAARLGWWHYDPNSNTAFFDKRFTEIFGVTGESCSNEKTLSLIHPEDLPHVLRAVEAALNPHNPIPYSAEYRIILDDGSMKWIEAHGAGTFEGSGESRRPIALVGTVQDITERRNIELLARHKDAQLKLALRVAQMGTWEFDPQTELVTTSGSTDDLYDLSPSEKPRSIDEYMNSVHPEDRECLKQATVQAANQGSDLSIEYRLLKRDGSARWISSRGDIIYDEHGGIARMIGALVDITDRKRAEEELTVARERAEEANRLKDRFIATLSHELRTPLTPLLGATQILQKMPNLPESIRQQIQIIKRNALLEARLIDDLLDLNKIEHNKLTLYHEYVNILDIIRGARETCSSLADERDIHIDVINQNVDYCIYGDPARLQQIVWNLLSNAIKFSPARSSIEVSLTQIDGRVRIAVKDRGKGIKPHQLESIFNPFEQGDEDTPRLYGGLGLGLVVSKRLVFLHRGSIWAESEGEGRGSTFFVEFPLVARPETKQKREHQIHSEASMQGRVLLCEDHCDTASVIKLLLELNGLTIDVTSTVAEAINALMQEEYDLVITDLGLPDGSGLDVMQVMKQKEVKGIVLSGQGMEADIVASMQAGFLNHLTKPVDIERLEAILRGILQQNID